MILPRFKYRSPRTVEEALSVFAENPISRYLAGGTDLLSQMRCGGCLPRLLIDIKPISALNRIEEREDGSIAIGASVSVAGVAAHPLIRKRYPVLVDCCLSLGSYPVRNRATVIGNICNASPCADTAAALLALDARAIAVSPAGRREVSIREFFRGPGQTVLRAGELVTELILPPETAGARGHFGRIARRRGVDVSTVAVLVTHLPGCAPAHRISLLSVAPTPLRVGEAERLLDREGPAAASRAAKIARLVCSPIDDLRGSAEYRREMVGVLLERGVKALAGGAGR